MIWTPTFFTGVKGKHRIEVWQGYDGGWRASVHFKGQMMGMEGKKVLGSLGAAKKYGLKLLRIYRKTQHRRVK